MISTSTVPDALMIGQHYKLGVTMGDHLLSIWAIAEPLLDVDPAKGGRVYVRKQDHGWTFASRDPHDLLCHPNSSRRRGWDRYKWVVDGNWLRRGYLTDAARSEQEEEGVYAGRRGFAASGF